MHDDTNPTPTAVNRRRCSRDSIALPDGDVLVPRRLFAEAIGVSERSVARMNLPTTYLSNVAHVKQNAGLQIISDRAQRKNQPPKRRRAA
jgi:hypothetical protein